MIGVYRKTKWQFLKQYTIYDFYNIYNIISDLATRSCQADAPQLFCYVE